MAHSECCDARSQVPIECLESDGMIGRALSWLVIQAIRFYQIGISPLMGPCCRFVPSCSQYAIEAVRKYGLVKGATRAIWRILRCHPFSAGGIDPP
jgi:putative membrane protein insertion efficiency factor